MQCVKPFARTPCGLGARAPIRVSRIGLSQRTLATRTRAEPEKEKQTSRASVDDEVLPTDEIAKLAALRRQQQANFAQDSNIVQGALEEAQLITWPRPQKAALDTVLVLFIVAGSGALLFGMNVLLAELSEWWYHLA
ncbi:hypothetical protein CHLRE_10g457650v5 [Chlamydomonas reinhardtii]|uniref:Uncharacterized protein n=1 Tax=Chlamydomonas reinhardtii TaxID=3055 RepID=A8I0R3_CHLRE|nr:uncharacterized protein CHLRE_10g457650v5 [Chlamydomonas reinhardtii]PNW77937.1 hypothetical protein CHLRE_10g457650v5 [Chlamydomonas reinhardtii]|eukprot:XP_001698382.1 predicted protein [Chlamydomonas reinhardtii]